MAMIAARQVTEFHIGRINLVAPSASPDLVDLFETTRADISILIDRNHRTPTVAIAAISKLPGVISVVRRTSGLITVPKLPHHILWVSAIMRVFAAVPREGRVGVP